MDELEKACEAVLNSGRRLLDLLGGLASAGTQGATELDRLLGRDLADLGAALATKDADAIRRELIFSSLDERAADAAGFAFDEHPPAQSARREVNVAIADAIRAARSLSGD